MEQHGRMCEELFPVSAGREGVVRELLGAGADVNKINDKGLTPLCVECFISHRIRLIL